MDTNGGNLGLVDKTVLFPATSLLWGNRSCSEETSQKFDVSITYGLFRCLVPALLGSAQGILAAKLAGRLLGWLTAWWWTWLPQKWPKGPGGKSQTHVMSYGNYERCGLNIAEKLWTVQVPEFHSGLGCESWVKDFFPVFPISFWIVSTCWGAKVRLQDWAVWASNSIPL